MEAIDRPDLEDVSDEKILEDAFHCRRRGDHRDAFERFMTVYRRDETNPFVLIEAARCDAAVMDYPGMRTLLTLAREKSEEDGFVLRLIGEAWYSFHFPEEALAVFEAASASDPEDAVSFAKVLGCLERMNRIEEAAGRLGALSRAMRREAALQPIRAKLALRAGDPEKAVALAEPFVRSPEKSLSEVPGALFDLAAAHEAQGRPDAAWDALLRAKVIQSKNPECDYTRALFPLHLAFLERVRERADAATVAGWSDRSPPGAPLRLAFILGHPRSGTTVVERILDNHPEIASASEYPAFELSIAEAAQTNPEGDRTFRDATPAWDVSGLREAYLKRMERVFPGPLGDRLLLDKNPGLTDGVHGLARMFPEAKFLVMLRDPRDVILSCFFRDFGLTRLGVACHTFEGAVTAWEATMRQWTVFRERIPRDRWLEIPYEDFVADPASFTDGMLKFLGCRPASTSADEALARGGFIRTPTYAQVGKKIRKDATGKWRPYAKHFEPFRARLEPLMAELGYSW